MNYRVTGFSRMKFHLLRKNSLCVELRARVLFGVEIMRNVMGIEIVQALLDEVERRGINKRIFIVVIPEGLEFT